MVSALTGPYAFQRALQQYLNAFAYKNAEGVDLWNIVQQHADLNANGNLTINKLAADWTTQVGYPFIRVSLNVDGTKMLIHNQVS
uniref:Peptidase_M1 domain-containing protein n=1 Tax=Bursaphelenchus xylophilus TaxID=6326 RepID=A0A1I7SJ42_BURXY